MKQLSGEMIASTGMPCAEAMLETVPVLVRTIRQHMRNRNVREMALVEFRAMAFVARTRGATLSSLAEHIGLSMPTMSRIVESLVQHRLLERTTARNDRRCMSLTLTAKGRQIYEAARSDTHRYLATRLATLDRRQRQSVTESLRLLRELFAAAEPRISE